MTILYRQALLSLRTLPRRIHHPPPSPLYARFFHSSNPLAVVKPFLLADIGEGITECQLIQWFVQPGARVEQFDKLCEVQSDKASVEITSPFDGVITKLYHEPDDMAVTGKPLVDIDIQSEISEADATKLAGGTEAAAEEAVEGARKKDEIQVEAKDHGAKHAPAAPEEDARSEQRPQPPSRGKQDHRSLATPAVRHLTKEHELEIADIEGTGKDGRVLKEDVQRHISRRNASSSSSPTEAASKAGPSDGIVPLSPVQTQMFKVMTRSLSIPHFLYTSTTDMSSLSTLRKKVNASATHKLTHLAFILKAVSLAFAHHPLLNSSLDTNDPQRPELTRRGAHNFGVAIDTPSGLVVPVVKHVQELSIAEIASTLRGLSEKARTNKLSPQDFSGATFTISNIGSIGGGVVSPVISAPQVAILGVGRSKVVPAFDQDGQLTKKEELVLSWSADHRVVDGAECARCAERVTRFLEEPEAMMIEMR